jgi:hypothetical protein
VAAAKVRAREKARAEGFITAATDWFSLEKCPEIPGLRLAAGRVLHDFGVK